MAVAQPHDYFLEAVSNATKQHVSADGGQQLLAGGLTFQYWNIPKVVMPGQTVHTAVGYNVNCGNPNAVVYKTVLADWQPDSPIAVLENGELEGQPRDERKEFSFTAPSTPGTYRLRLAMVWAFQGIQHFYGDGPAGDSWNPGVGDYAEVTLKVESPPAQDRFLEAVADGTRLYFSPDGGRQALVDGFTAQYWNIPKVVAPGQTVHTAVGYNVNCGNPNAVVYKTVLADWQPNSPLAVLENGELEGQPRDVRKEFSFTAPSTPGTYRLRLAMVWAFQSIQHFYGDGPPGDSWNPGVGNYCEVTLKVESPPAQDHFLEAVANGTRLYFSPDGGRQALVDGLAFQYWNIPKVVAPGQTVHTAVGYNVNCGNPNAVVYKTVLADWQPNSPLAVLENGELEGTPRDIRKEFSFTAPTTPGTYRLRLAMVWAFQSIQHFYGDGPPGNSSNPGVGHYCEVTVTVTPLVPALGSSFSNMTALLGGNIQMAVQAVGSQPLSYYWVFNGTNNIPGASGAVLDLNNLNLSQEGRYSVIVSNAFGTVTNTADLSILTAWSQVGNLSVARSYHSATMLNNGKILIVGGTDAANTASASCELFGPANLTLTPVASLNHGRTHHQAVKLTNGKVLVVGGSNPSAYMTSCELYDPAANTWTDVASLQKASSDHRLALLDNGKVLRVCGPTPSGFGTTICELYDPAANTWTYTGSTSVGGHSRACVKMSDGKVLTAGGYMFNDAVEVYDPASGTWTLVGHLTHAVSGPSAVQLDNGNVLIMGGSYWSGSTMVFGYVDVYDPGTGLVSSGPSMLMNRAEFQAVKLPDGDVLAISGIATNGNNATAAACDRYDASTGQWQEAPPLNVSRFGAQAIYANGSVFVFGGYFQSPATNFAVAMTEMLPVGGVWISGMVSYVGPQQGLVKIVATPAGGSMSAATTTLKSGLGEYRLDCLTYYGGHSVTAFVDSNQNGSKDSWEAQGSFVGNPLSLSSNLTGVNIVLSNPDTDSDGLPDWWELQHFGNLSYSGSDDPDHDNYTNAEEFQYGMNPSSFEIGPMSIWTAVEVGWRSVSGTNYQVQWSTLDTTTWGTNEWHDLDSPIPGNGSINTLLQSTRGQEQRMYRVILAP